MSEIQLGDNCNDLSVQSGANAGFQFEFRCECCNDARRSEFVAYRGGRASSWLGKAASLVGGLVGNVSDAAQSLADAGYTKAHDDALAVAVEAARPHYHRCARCHQYVCAACWSTDKGLCRTCAPDAEIEIEAARAEGEVAAAREAAITEGQKRGLKKDVKRDRQLVCPKCGAETHGAKFCPECGEKMAVKTACPKCAAEVSPGTKFCPECGQKLG